VSVRGGETAYIQTQLPNPIVLEITPNVAELVISSGSDFPDDLLWLLAHAHWPSPSPGDDLGVCDRLFSRRTDVFLECFPADLVLGN
jgi:hypothetical protein